VNLVKEAPGIAANERLWETIDAVLLTADEPRECMIEMGAALAADDDDYVAAWGAAIGGWCDLFDRVPRTLDAAAWEGV
jgi:hypothetical protein